MSETVDKFSDRELVEIYLRWIGEGEDVDDFMEDDSGSCDDVVRDMRELLGAGNARDAAAAIRDWGVAMYGNLEDADELFVLAGMKPMFKGNVCRACGCADPLVDEVI